MSFYDNFSVQQPSGLGASISRTEARKCLARILGHKEEAKTILEVGPGRGDFAGACSQQEGLEYSCVDINERLLQELDTLGGRKVRSMVPGLPFANDSFDVTYASNVLEHMVDFPAANQFLIEMKRVTAPGGLVCHRAPDAMAWGMQFWNGDYTHSFVTTKRRVAQLYLDTGLQIEEVVTVAGSVLGWPARGVSLIGKLIPGWIVDHGANPTSRISKLVYSAKTTFLRGFLIIGRKT